MEHIPFQVKQNASEYSDFLKDLGQWEKDMKEKENRRSTNNSISSTKNKPSIPPPRSNKSSSEQKSTKIKAYDYRAWDKLDVVSILVKS